MAWGETAGAKVSEKRVMAEKRLRKRRTRQSEPDLALFEEPPKKKSKKQNSPATVVRPRRRQRNGRLSNPSSSPSSVRAGAQKAGKKGKSLLVSLNLQDNGLHVPGQAVTEVSKKKPTIRGKGRARLTNQQQQRDQSVGSDGGSSNGSGGSGRTMAFKNPNFTVLLTVLVSQTRLPEGRSPFLPSGHLTRKTNHKKLARLFIFDVSLLVVISRSQQEESVEESEANVSLGKVLRSRPLHPYM